MSPESIDPSVLRYHPWMAWGIPKCIPGGTSCGDIIYNIHCYSLVTVPRTRDSIFHAKEKILRNIFVNKLARYLPNCCNQPTNFKLSFQQVLSYYASCLHRRCRYHCIVIFCSLELLVPTPSVITGRRFI